MNIAILGALDRYNYGDLLYSIIFKEYLNKIDKNFKFDFYGLVKANFKKYTTISTKPFGKFYNDIKNDKSKNVIIIAGGAVIGCRAGKLYSFLHPTPFLNLYSNFCKLLNLPNPSDIIARRKLNITWGKFPFSPVRPNKNCMIIYSSVGDKYLDNSELNEMLKNADFISVRNLNLYKRLKKHIPQQDKLVLTVDSAAVISKIWPKDTLKKIISAQAATLVDKFKNGYIVFQAKSKTKRHLSVVANQLEKLNKKKGLAIVLVPLGRAVRHEDDILLKQLEQKLRVPVEFADLMNIHDIMYIIASSKLFIGTSLHGNITAMSYGVNHLGITNIPKLDQYLKHWDIEPNKTDGCIKPSQIYEKACYLLNNSNATELIENAQKLSELADTNLNRILNLIKRFADN